MRARRTVIAILVIAALIGVGGTIAATRPREVPLVLVNRQDVVETTVASGRVVAPAEIQVGVVSGGVVSEVPVSEGQSVKRGDLLLRLDDRVELAAVAQARAAVAQSRAHVVEVTSFARGRARANLEAAEVELRLQKTRLERMRRLFAGGAVAGTELEDVETAHALAQARRDAAAVEAEAAGDQGAQVLVAQAQLEAAQAAFQLSEARLAQLRIVAQGEARVLRRRVEPGDAVTPGRTLLVLGSARTGDGVVEIVVEPDEKSLAVLAPGQQASCAADAFPRAPFAATVREIAPQVDSGRGTVEVRLAVPEPPAFLRADMTVSVEIVTGKKEKTLVVPLAAVRDLATSEPWVLVLEGDRAEKRPIVVGARSAELIEVTKGLTEGASVLTDATTKPGARVKPL